MKTKTNLLQNEEGSALIEFVVFGLVAQISILMFAGSLLEQQKLQLAVESSARQAVRAATLSIDAAQGDVAKAIETQQSANFGLVPGRLRITVTPVAPAAGELVSATASIDGVSATARMRVPRS
jgi:hypothetical protein